MRTETHEGVEMELEAVHDAIAAELHLLSCNPDTRRASVLGIAIARLAMANAEINRLTRQLDEMRAIAEAHDARR